VTSLYLAPLLISTPSSIPPALYLLQNMKTSAVNLRRVYRTMPTTSFPNASVLVPELSTVCCNRVTTSHSYRCVSSRQTSHTRILLGPLFSPNPSAQSLFFYPLIIRAFIIYSQPVWMAFSHFVVKQPALLFGLGTGTTLHPAYISHTAFRSGSVACACCVGLQIPPLTVPPPPPECRRIFL